MCFFFWRIGFGFFMANSFARGDSVYGPYDLWFERKFLFVYWAVTQPNRLCGYFR